MAKLVELRFKTEVTNKAKAFFEVKGFSEGVLDNFPKRRASIESELESGGEAGGKAAAATLRTRVKKVGGNAKEAEESWRMDLRKMGVVVDRRMPWKNASMAASPTADQ
jgi:hypothetical protein